ncbi:MAG: acetylglutamate kinase [Isosphaera sp.]|nr:acetylglutamate kinase [Isosphaera sp.]
MPPSPLSAEAFAAAVLRVARFRGRPVVVKLGGSAMEDPAATDACLRSVAALHLLGVPLVLVHGGGKPIDRAMAEAGLTPRKVAGRRYTDETTLAIVVRVLNEINARLVSAIRDFGAVAFGETDLLDGERLGLVGTDGPIDLGRVGRVTGVDHPRCWDDTSWGTPVPVIPSLALDPDGGWLNVNADTAAAAVAGQLNARSAIFLTDTPGVLRDRHDPASLVPHLTERECRDLIASGVIDGGMVPKVEACFEALEAGASAALILDGRVPFSLLDVFLSDTFTGTEITR